MACHDFWSLFFYRFGCLIVTFIINSTSLSNHEKLAYFRSNYRIPRNYCFWFNCAFIFKEQRMRRNKLTNFFPLNFSFSASLGVFFLSLSSRFQARKMFSRLFIRFKFIWNRVDSAYSVCVTFTWREKIIFYENRFIEATT